MELWVATTNKGKLNEFRNLTASVGITIKSPADLPVYSSPAETGATFLDNARIKARTMKAIKPECWVAAEDSGLEVEGLGGMPGIHSARYGGPKASDAENNAKVLKMLQIRSPANRKACFKCCIVAFGPDGVEHVFEGRVDGQISTASKGKEGFGYDFVFIPDGETKTFAELGVAFKNKISHRAQAIRQLIGILNR